MFRSPMARVGFLLLAFSLLASCTAPANPATSGPTPSVPLLACRLTAPDAPVSIAARCATIDVPESHADPAGATIGLNVVVVPAVGNSVRNDPLVLLAGGPGQAASVAFAPVLHALRDVRQSRDLVLVDQRGTGRSAPLLCPADDRSVTADEAAIADWIRACLEALPGDPSQYTTDAAVRDLDLVRAALGYEQLNLLGVSYGTRVAQHYARRFPERTRSLVLDGIVRPELAIGAEVARDGQRAFDLIVERCDSNPTCSAAFPNIQAQLNDLLDTLAANPAEVQLDDPHTGAPTTLTLTRDLAATTIFNLSYAPETSALIPLMITTAANGDLRPLAAQSLLITGQAAAGIAIGMRFSVICAEDAPFFSDTIPAAATSYLGATVAEQLAAPCAIWPADTAPADLRTPLQSDVPALLLSGAADPVTPPANGDAVAATLPNSLHIVAPKQGHNLFYRGCIPRLIADLLAAGSVAGLEASCVDQLQPTPFFVSFSGPGT
jgi:pimeloyl-ACP methyl ester carboxylesterase